MRPQPYRKSIRHIDRVKPPGENCSRFLSSIKASWRMKNSEINQRRDFLKATLALSAGTAVVPGFLNALPGEESNGHAGKGFTFLFQGDSITDGNRSRNLDWNHVMGHGYPFIISSKLWYEHPQKEFHFFNRGISGNTVADLTGRWQQDTLEVKPDVLSILIGINDTSRFLYGNKVFTAEKYETDYRALLQLTTEQIPNLQLVLCEPFILPVGKVKDKWDDYSAAVKQRQASVLKLSQEFNAIYIPFQSAFNNALSKAPAEYWIWDGIHPMPAGHELMAREWMRGVGKKLKFIR